MKKVLCVIVLLAALTASSSFAEIKPDLDLIRFSSFMAYSGFMNILCNPSAYTGKIIKLTGQFAFAQDEETGENYYGVSMMDATACCTIGLDFVLKNSYKYPQDSPEIGEIITVSGKFEQYRDGEDVFCRLVDADIL